MREQWRGRTDWSGSDRQATSDPVDDLPDHAPGLALMVENRRLRNELQALRNRIEALADKADERCEYGSVRKDDLVCHAPILLVSELRDVLEDDTPNRHHINVQIDTTHLEGRALAMAQALNAYGMYVIDHE